MVVEPIVVSLVTIAATLIVGSLMAEIDEEEEPVFQELIVNYEEDQ
jgi:hypothetical protein